MTLAVALDSLVARGCRPQASSFHPVEPRVMFQRSACGLAEVSACGEERVFFLGVSWTLAEDVPVQAPSPAHEGHYKNFTTHSGLSVAVGSTFWTSFFTDFDAADPLKAECSVWPAAMRTSRMPTLMDLLLLSPSLALAVSSVSPRGPLAAQAHHARCPARVCRRLQFGTVSHGFLLRQRRLSEDARTWTRGVSLLPGHRRSDLDARCFSSAWPSASVSSPGYAVVDFWRIPIVYGMIDQKWKVRKSPPVVRMDELDSVFTAQSVLRLNSGDPGPAIWTRPGTIRRLPLGSEQTWCASVR